MARMSPDRPAAETPPGVISPPPPGVQRGLRILLLNGLVLLGIYILREFLPALVPAAIFAIATRTVGAQLARRAVLFGFMLVALFFLLRDGRRLGRKLLELADRAIGPQGERIADHMIAAVHGTVNGLVMVGLGQGVVLAIAYAL